MEAYYSRLVQLLKEEETTGMRFKKEPKKDSSLLDITPIVDTVFNALIFFAPSPEFYFRTRYSRPLTFHDRQLKPAAIRQTPRG